MEDYSYKTNVIASLKKRNAREHSFRDVIIYSNKLLESLDYLQRSVILRNIQTTKAEQTSPAILAHDLSAEERTMLMKCCDLQNDLAECHKKISDYAQQVIEFRNALDQKNQIISNQKREMEEMKNTLSNYQELCKKHCKELADIKIAFQNKVDECDALNITYSSLECKKNNLEIENQNLKAQLAEVKKAEIARSLSESLPKVAQDSSDKNVKKFSSGTQVREERASLKITSVDVNAANLNSIVPEKIKYEFNAHDSDVNAVLWLPTFSHLITAGADRKVKLWELLKDGSIVLKKSVRDCNSSIMSVDLDADSSLLLCTSCDFASRIWTLNDFTLRHTLTGHSGKVMSAKFMYEINKIVSGSLDQTLKVWDLRRRACIQTSFSNSQVHDVICKSGHVIISGHADKKVRLWDMRSNKETSQIASTGVVTSLDLSKNGYLLLVSQRDNVLKVFDLRTNFALNSLKADNFEVAYDWTRAKFSPDDQYCVCGSKNGSVFIWNINKETVEKELKG
ncbi:Autophagy-related protein 16-1, partial [Stegodyphus mimosarum]